MKHSFLRNIAFIAILCAGSFANAQVIDGPQGEYQLTITPVEAEVGEPFTIHWQAPASDNLRRDRLGVYRDDGTNKRLAVKSTGATTEGSLEFTLTEVGSYEVRYLKNGRNIQAGDSLFFQVVVPHNSVEYVLQEPDTEVIAGKSFTITWSTPADANKKKDWIGIFAEGADDRKRITRKSTGGKTQGSVSFKIGKPGTYEVRYYKNNGYTRVGNVLTITVAPKPPSTSRYAIQVRPDSIREGDTVTVAWQAPGGAVTALDWVGMYRVGAENREFVTWKYTNFRGGATTFYISAPGTYEFRYFKNNTYTRAAVSNPVTVTGSAEDFEGAINYPPRAQGPIIVFGDSLVSGVGASSGQDFVSELRRRIPNQEFINAGRSGDTTRRALTRVDSDIVAQQPKIVIVLLGGNDLLRQRINQIDESSTREAVRRLLEELERTQLLENIPVSETFENLKEIIRRAQASGALVVLLGVQGGFLGDNYADEFRAAAAETGAVYIPDVTRGVLGNPTLMSDLIHPNNQGYDIMAQRVEPVIEQLIAE